MIRNCLVYVCDSVSLQKQIDESSVLLSITHFMEISIEVQHQIADELLFELDGKLDGGRKNILVQHCPFCGHDGYKFGIYIGVSTGYKKFGACNCYHCNRRCRDLKGTLNALGFTNLMPKETTNLEESLTCEINLFEDDEIDDSLIEIQMPKGYKRCFRNTYLKSRGFIADDFEYFPCGTNRNLDLKFADYVLLEIRDAGRLVGFVGRHIWSKEDIEEYNFRHRYQIRRYNNSIENGFGKLLYNYDAIKQYQTRTVILCEGVFDVIALTRKLDLYDNHAIVPIATFGKKISEVQIFKLQSKGVEQVVLGYDADARETIGNVAMQLDNYFDVYIADLNMSEGKDWDEMSVDDIYNVFANRLKTVREFNLE